MYVENLQLPIPNFLTHDTGASCSCSSSSCCADPRMDTTLEWKDNVSHPVLEMTSCSCFRSLMTCWMSQAIYCSFIFSV